MRKIRSFANLDKLLRIGRFTDLLQPFESNLSSNQSWLHHASPSFSGFKHKWKIESPSCFHVENLFRQIIIEKLNLNLDVMVAFIGTTVELLDALLEASL